MLNAVVDQLRPPEEGLRDFVKNSKPQVAGSGVAWRGSWTSLPSPKGGVARLSSWEARGVGPLGRAGVGGVAL